MIQDFLTFCGFLPAVLLFKRCSPLIKSQEEEAKKSSGTGTTDPPVLDVSLFSFAPFGDSDLP